MIAARIISRSMRPSTFASAMRVLSSKTEDFVRSRSLDGYVEIERGMVHIEQALMPDKPDVAEVVELVNVVMPQYNAVVTDVQKEARARK